MPDTDQTYEGYPNRETWAVALRINNDQGWQEQVHGMLRSVDWDTELAGKVINVQHIGIFQNQRAGEMLKDNVEYELEPMHAQEYERGPVTLQLTETQWSELQDIGSMWRVDWYHLGELFLSDMREIDES